MMSRLMQIAKAVAQIRRAFSGYNAEGSVHVATLNLAGKVNCAEVVRNGVYASDVLSRMSDVLRGSVVAVSALV